MKTLAEIRPEVWLLLFSPRETVKLLLLAVWYLTQILVLKLQSPSELLVELKSVCLHIYLSTHLLTYLLSICPSIHPSVH